MARFVVGISAAAIVVLASVGPASAWGAIAVDDVTGMDPEDVGYSLVTGHATKSDAEKDALESCRAIGNDDCRIAASFQKCGAYAASTTKYGGGRAANLR